VRATVVKKVLKEEAAPHRGGDGEERTPAPFSSLTRASISGTHAAVPRPTATHTPTAPKPYQPYSFINELRPSDLQIGEVQLPSLDESLSLQLPQESQQPPPPAPPPPPQSFINELRPAAPNAGTHELLADLDDVHPADEDDDRTIEHYAPSSVRDLDYDSDSTSEVPSEWLDHLAASARPSDRPPSMALTPTIPPPSLEPTPTPSLPVQPVNYFGSFPPGSFPTPSAILPVTSLVPPPVFVPTPTPTPTSTHPVLQPRSNPIPWNPQPPPVDRSSNPPPSPLRRALGFFAAVILWVILIAIALRVLIGH
jgi:hypothetical protein